MKIICFCGKNGAGKSTCAKYLQRKQPQYLYMEATFSKFINWIKPIEYITKDWNDFWNDILERLEITPSSYKKDIFIQNRLAFSLPIKYIISFIADIPLTILNATTDYNREIRETYIPPTLSHLGKTVRELLEYIGSLAREYDEDIWVKILYRIMCRTNFQNYIIDDLRFSNEYIFMKNLNAQFYHVVRGDEAKTTGHISRYSYLDFCDDLPKIYNNGDKEELFAQLNL